MQYLQQIKSPDDIKTMKIPELKVLAQEIREEIVLYSIVNSLTELTGVNKVQLSVNGDTKGYCRYTYELSKMYEKDLSLLFTETTEGGQ